MVVFRSVCHRRYIRKQSPNCNVPSGSLPDPASMTDAEEGVAMHGSRRDGGRGVRLRLGRAVAVGLVLLAGTTLAPAPAGAETLAHCQNNFSAYQPADWLGNIQYTASLYASPYPYMNTWTTGLYTAINLSQIDCRESTYVLSAHTSGSSYWGMWQQKNVTMQLYIGGTLTDSFNCYMYGCFGNPNWLFQDFVGMRYVKDHWGTPGAAWNSEVVNGYY
jgi:hypothetical protein